MSSKRSAKPSAASQGYQGNKGAAKRYLEPAFIQKLRAKEADYFIGADQRKSSAGEWFRKDVIEDPLFKAIVYLRRRHENEQKLAKCSPELLDQLLAPEDPEPGRQLVDVVRQGNIGKLKDIVKFCELFESKYQRTREEQSDPLPWEYYAARAALGFLVTKIKIPTKTEVRKAALRERAIAELPVMYQVGTEELLPALQEVAPKEMPVDEEPAPDQDADSYYKTDQDEPEYDPDYEPPAEEKKPTLAQQRAELLIAARVEKLQLEHTPRVWANTWARVFKDLDLKDLPRC